MIIIKTKLLKKKKILNENANKIAKELNLSINVINFLIGHGYTTKEDIVKFLHFEEKDFRDVSKMVDFEPFVERLCKAISERQNIVIYGDYDCDGITATSIFLWALKGLGIDAKWIIPNRFSEGYGLSVKSIDRLMKEYPDVDLIVTVDNGIVAIDSVNLLKSKNVDVIVSDHHIALPNGNLPNCPVVCENRLDESENKEHFCGAELARRISVELYKRLNKNDSKSLALLEKLYCLSSLATVSDVIPLNPSNHYVLKHGLEILNSSDDVLPCFKALKEVCSLETIDEGTFGFKYGPMVNAAGRIIGDVDVAVNLFMSTSYEEAMMYANQLFAINEERKELTETEYVTALEEYHSQENNKIIVLHENQYSEGIAGIIAGKITEKYFKPCICLAKNSETVYKGSARSIEGFNIKEALDKCAELMIGYGGHAGAAGLSIEASAIEDFTAKLNEIGHDALNYEPEIVFDDILNIKYLSVKNIEVYNDFKKVLSPFGEGFRKPLLAICGQIDKSSVRILKEKHVKINIYNKDASIESIWFNAVNDYEKFLGNKLIVWGEPSLNVWKENVKPQLSIDNMQIW